jgi:uncharacterized protein (UPF0371 family)
VGFLDWVEPVGRNHHPTRHAGGHHDTPGDDAGLRRLGVNLTSDANFSTKNLFVS